MEIAARSKPASPTLAGSSAPLDGGIGASSRPHRLDRLNSGEREIAEDEGRISEGRKFVRLRALFRFDYVRPIAPLAIFAAAEVRAIDPGPVLRLVSSTASFCDVSGNFRRRRERTAS